MVRAVTVLNFSEGTVVSELTPCEIACSNLLGNLCRHSAHCYPALVRHGLLARLLTRLSDQDKQVTSYNGPLLVPKHNMAPLDASMLAL
eukprot:COSAG01_NODE_382_length_17840_cov_68.658663_18_plen_89_part_00